MTMSLATEDGYKGNVRLLSYIRIQIQQIAS
jgi:hypothetical protein